MQGKLTLPGSIKHKAEKTYVGKEVEFTIDGLDVRGFVSEVHMNDYVITQPMLRIDVAYSEAPFWIEPEFVTVVEHEEFTIPDIG
jgi:hypothetical protein